MTDTTPILRYDPAGIKERFIDAMQQTLNNLSEEHSLVVRSGLLKLLGERSPSLFASPDVLSDLAADIFSNEILRTWIFDTKFVFFMGIFGGEGRAMLLAITQDLALAASEDMDLFESGFLSPREKEVADTVAAMPKELYEELPNASQIRAVIAANTWLVIVLLLFAFVDLEHQVLKAPALAVTK